MMPSLSEYKQRIRHIAASKDFLRTPEIFLSVEGSFQTGLGTVRTTFQRKEVLSERDHVLHLTHVKRVEDISDYRTASHGVRAII